MYFMNVFSLITLTDLTVLLNTIKSKNIDHTVVFHCAPCEVAIEMQKLFNKHDVCISTLKIDDNMTLTIPYTYHRVAMIVNASCEKWEAALNVIDAKIAFKKYFTWMLLTEDLDSTVDTLSNHPIEVDSDMTVIHKKKGRYNFYETYTTGFHKKNGIFRINYVGFWNSSLHVESRPRFDLGGVVLKVPVVITEDIAVPLERYLSTVDTSQGDMINKNKFYAMMTFIRTMFNITYELQRTNSWGYPKNNSFDGVVGALHREGADIGGSPLFFRKDRAQCAEYVAQAWETRPCFLFRHPKHPGGYLSIYTRPLTAAVWGCIFASMALSAAMLIIMLRLRVLRATGDDGDSSTSLACLFIWSAICQQGMSISRHSASVKIIMFVTFAFAVTLYQYYNATVVSTLLQDAPKNIKTLQDLVRTDLKLGVEDVIYNKEFFKRFKDVDPTINRLYHKVSTARRSYYSPEEGIALVKKGGFAFHLEASAGYRLMRRSFSEREICELQEIPMFPPQDTGAVVKIGSPYKEYIAYGIRKMAESGIMHRLKLIWDEPHPRCVNTPDSSLISVTIREFSTALIVLIFGMAASMVVLFCEILVFEKNKRVLDFRH